MNRFHVWLAGGIAVWTGCGSSSTPASPTTDGSAEVPTQADAASSTSTLEVLRRARIGSHNSAGWPNTDEASAEVDLGAGPFQRVTLVVDLESTCYPFDKWKANPPPPQQSWPADCDAFDRNLNVFIDNPLAVESDAGEKDGSSDAPIDVDDAGNSDAPIVQMVAGPPPYELVHAITPFGGPEHLETDITDFANGLPGKHHLRAHLLSWSDMAGQVTGSNNGWTISVTIHIARGPAPHEVLAVIPLYAGELPSGVLAPTVPFTVPSGTQSARLEYRTSGHGQGRIGIGCIGPAEEFCRRIQHVYVDRAMVKTVDPWRECDALCTPAHYGPMAGGIDYCLENPCGNMNSVRAPRANWCPGSMTPPFAWKDIAPLEVPGPHTFTFDVSTILPDGSWQVSAIYYAFGAR